LSTSHSVKARAIAMFSLSRWVSSAQFGLRMLSTKIPQTWQQPVPGERRGGVEHQLIGFLVLPQPASRQPMV
jgi:hypothetical protein